MSVAMIPVDSIRLNSITLRNVDQKSVNFQELIDSVKQNGILNAINVSPAVDAETQEQYYTLCDGLHRLTAAKAAGFTEVPAVIMNSTELELLKRQIIANATKEETKHAQYAKQLNKILEMDPMTTTAQLAASLNKSEAWLKDHLNLTKLHVDVATLVDEGRINPTSAIALSKLPADVQLEYINQAQEMPHTEFTSLIGARKKELDKARREGRAAAEAVFEPTAYMQKTADIKSEMETGANGNLVIAEEKLTSAEQGWKAALQWVMHLDVFSVREQRQKHEDVKKTNEEKRKNAELERDKKKAAAAELKAKRAKLALETNEAGGDVSAVLAEFDKANGLAQ